MLFNIQLPKNFCIKYCKLNEKEFFFCSNTFFFSIPKAYTFTLEKDVLTLFCSCFELKNDFTKFVSVLARILKKNGNLFVKKLLFKGLGLKAFLSNENRILELKLGFSHIVKVVIPTSKINVQLIKNGLVVFGSNLVRVSNFLYKIKSLKLPNIYKGKGIWYKNEIIKLKEIKKS